MNDLKATLATLAEDIYTVRVFMMRIATQRVDTELLTAVVEGDDELILERLHGFIEEKEAEVEKASGNILDPHLVHVFELHELIGRAQRAEQELVSLRALQMYYEQVLVFIELDDTFQNMALVDLMLIVREIFDKRRQEEERRNAAPSN